MKIKRDEMIRKARRCGIMLCMKVARGRVTSLQNLALFQFTTLLHDISKCRRETFAEVYARTIVDQVIKS